MVLVTVSNDYAPDFISITFNVAEIRNYKVNTGQIGIGKCKTAIDKKHIVAVFVKSHILSDFVNTA